MKCDICKKNIQTTFLNKLLGTVIKDRKGKKHSVCKECQKQLKTKDELLSKL
ncbi:hypothetical protein KY325_01475 [Candidatus Woesearchaeota archaeon]|nr:hypothetical protein [Candidatus Woesearchaeota archaeon]MBW3017808.1 hypothetical protein [Candidatus Woesearchaeota archaeon]